MCRRRATVCEQHCIVAFQQTRSEFCTRRLISTFLGRPFRQARIFERIFLGWTRNRRSRSVARTQKLSPAMIFANSAILSKIVILIGASRRVPPRRIPPPQTFRDHLYLYGFIVQIQASADSRQSSDFDHNFRNFACSRMPDMIMRLSQRCSKPLRPGLHRQVPHQADPH